MNWLLAGALAFLGVTFVLDKFVNPWLESWLARQNDRPSRDRIEYLNNILVDYDPRPGDGIAFKPDGTMTITRPESGEVWNVAP